MVDPDRLLYIEPSNMRSAEPVMDDLTERLATAWRDRRSVTAWRGSHACACGERSDSHDYELPGGEITNALALHYLMFHRDEIPREQLARVAMLGR